MASVAEARGAGPLFARLVDGAAAHFKCYLPNHFLHRKWQGHPALGLKDPHLPHFARLSHPTQKGGLVEGGGRVVHRTRAPCACLCIFFSTCTRSLTSEITKDENNAKVSSRMVTFSTCCILLSKPEGAKGEGEGNIFS